MKFSKEKAFPFILGAVPVLLVLLLAGFISMNTPKGATPSPSAAQPAQPNFSLPGLGSSPATQPPSPVGSSPTPSGASSTSSSGGGSLLCLPLFGCI